MLSFILAPSGYGKTHSIIAEINAILDRNEGRKIFVIVPEQESVKMEAELLTVCGNRINADVEVINFSRLANRVFREAGGMTYKYIDNAGKDLITAAALETLKKTCPTFERVVDDTEYIRMLRLEMDTLRSRGVHPSDILRAEESLSEEDRGGTSFSEKLCDFATVFSAYETSLSDSNTDTTDDIVRLAEALRDYDFFDGTYVFVDGFYDYTVPQYDVIERIMKSCYKLTVTFSLSRHDPEGIFRKTSEAFDTLRERAEKNEVEYICTELDTNYRTKSHGLKTLSEAIMTGEELHCDAADGVTVTEVKTPYDECVFTAREIVKLVKSGVKLSEIAICAASIGSYGASLENVLESYGIAHLSCTERSVVQMPILATVLSALDVINSSFYYQHMRSYLKSGYLGLTEEEAYALENYVSLWSITKKDWYSESDWVMHPKGYNGGRFSSDEEELATVNRARHKVFEPLRKLAEGFADRSTVRSKAEAMLEYFDALELSQKVEEYNNDLAEAFGVSDYDDEVMAWNLLIDSLDMLVSHVGQLSVGRDRFIKYLRLVLSDMSFRKIPSAIEEVELGDVEFVRNKNVKHLFFLGFNDGIFPSVSDTPSVFTESEREWLYRHDIRLRDSAEDKLRDQSFQFLLAVLRPSHALHLVYHVSSAESSKARSSPSYFLSTVTEVLNVKPTVPSLDIPVAPHELMEYVFSSDDDVSELFDSEEAKSFYREASYLKSFAERIGEPFRLEADARPQKAELVLTQTKFEKYEKCRFSYFVEYMLNTRVRKKAAFSYSEIGSYVHKILEDVLKTLTSDGRAITDTESIDVEALTRRIAREYIEEVAPNVRDTSPKFKYLVDNICSFVLMIVENIKEEFSVSLFEPKYFEEDIIDSEVVSPYVLELSDGGKLIFKGVIDRVDTYLAPDGTEYIRVVDYKTRTGGKSFSLEDVLNGMNLQMLIYLFAFTGTSTATPRAEAGIMYMPAAKGDFSPSGDYVSDEVLREQIDSDMKRSGMYLDDRTIIDAMESGKEKRFVGLKYDKSTDTYKSNSAATLATLEQFGIIHRYMDHLFERTVKELKSGMIDADPIEDPHSSGGTVCSYCPYHPICRFEGEARERVRSKYPLVAMQEELGELPPEDAEE